MPTSKPQRLHGKIAVITGGGAGIGAVTAGLFAAEGAKLLLVDRDAAALKATAEQIRTEQAGAVVATFAADVALSGAAEDAIKVTQDRFGGMSVLVNNAAMRDLDGISSADPAKWQAVLSTNVVGTVNFCRAALPALKAAGNGAIVNVSSCYGVRGRRGFAAYDASKAALLAVTRSLAAEGAEHGVRANAVCPGGTLTSFTIGRQQQRGRTASDMRTERKTDTLLGRWAEPLEVAYPILWLASDEASYVTGATLMVDGGQP